MRIPINAARMLLFLVIQNSHPYVTAAILARLNRIGLDESFLIESLNELTQVHNELLAEEPDVASWPGLSGEFSAFFSWLMQDLKTSETSVDFDKDLSRATVQSLADLGIEGPYPAQLKLKIHHWVVGACWSKGSHHSSGLVFPLKPLSLDKKQAGIAYNGLVRHLQTLEALGLEGDPEPDLEMSVSGIAIRVVGLAEALNPAIRDNASAALSSQLSKFSASGVKTKVKLEVERDWHSTAIQLLVQIRNSIAHVSAGQESSFSQIVDNLSGDWIQKVSTFASTLMSAEILWTLEEVPEAKVEHWQKHFRQQLQNLNLLIPLQSSIPEGLREVQATVSPSQLVTPLG